MEQLESFVKGALGLLTDLIGVDRLLAIVFAHTGTDRAKAVLDAEMAAADKAADALEDDKFPPEV